jgi:GH25 family lysozyme M1 (1,4-beta-N-acetylmuramidase)
MTRARVIDISHWSGVINYEIFCEKADAVIMKCSQGNYLIDHTFSDNWSKATKYKMIRGHFHYYDPVINPKAQALYYYNMACSAGGGKPDIPPVLDVELAPFVPDYIYATLEEISSLFNRKPMVYTSPYAWGSMGMLTWSKDFPLWIAQYPYKNYLPGYLDLFEAMNPWLPIGFNAWKIWQCNDQVPGVLFGLTENAADFNLFNGTIDDMKAWLGMPVTSPITTPILPQAMVLEDGLRIRSSPSTSSPIIGRLMKGNVVNFARAIQKGSNIWLAVFNGETLGWSAVTYNGQSLMRVL